jgi:hypothetical protein
MLRFGRAAHHCSNLAGRRVRASLEPDAEAHTQFVVANDMASRSGLFALLTTSGQGLSTWIG